MKESPVIRAVHFLSGTGKRFPFGEWFIREDEPNDVSAQIPCREIDDIDMMFISNAVDRFGCRATLMVSALPKTMILELREP